MQSQSGVPWRPAEAHHCSVCIQMRAEVQPCFPVVHNEEGTRMFCQTRRAGSSFTPMVWSLASPGQQYLLQNKASPCCNQGSGRASGGCLLKSSGTDLKMGREDHALMCSSALMFVKVLFFFYPEVFW